MLLFACAGVSEKQEKQAGEQFGSEINTCYQESSTYMAYAECFNEAITRYFNAVKFPYPEIIPLANSYNLALAERVEAGELTREQAWTMEKQFMYQALYQAIQKDEAETERRLEWQNLIWSLNNNYLYNHPITCVQNGNIFTCN